MHLPPMGREYYRLNITTVQPVDPTAWEATFDGGTTWHQAADVDGLPSWLVAGPTGNPSGAVAVIPADTSPMVRMTDNPEIVVRRAPTIFVALP